MFHNFLKIFPVRKSIYLNAAATQKNNWRHNYQASVGRKQIRMFYDKMTYTLFLSPNSRGSDQECRTKKCRDDQLTIPKGL